MSLPSMSGTGRLTAPPEMRFTANGVGICTVSLAFNSRRKNQATGEWEDGDVFYIRATAFRELGEHIVDTLDKGDEVNVIGRLKTDQWEDRKTGEKRSAPSLLIDAIGPNLRYATAKVSKASREGGRGEYIDEQSGLRRTAEADPWASPPRSDFEPGSEPPF